MFPFSGWTSPQPQQKQSQQSPTSPPSTLRTVGSPPNAHASPQRTSGTPNGWTGDVVFRTPPLPACATGVPEEHDASSADHLSCPRRRRTSPPEGLPASLPRSSATPQEPHLNELEPSFIAANDEGKEDREEGKESLLLSSPVPAQGVSQSFQQEEPEEEEPLGVLTSSTPAWRSGTILRNTSRRSAPHTAVMIPRENVPADGFSTPTVSQRRKNDKDERGRVRVCLGRVDPSPPYWMDFSEREESVHHHSAPLQRSGSQSPTPSPPPSEKGWASAPHKQLSQSPVAGASLTRQPKDEESDHQEVNPFDAREACFSPCKEAAGGAEGIEGFNVSAECVSPKRHMSVSPPPPLSLHCGVTSTVSPSVHLASSLSSSLTPFPLPALPSRTVDNKVDSTAPATSPWSSRSLSVPQHTGGGGSMRTPLRGLPERGEEEEAPSPAVVRPPDGTPQTGWRLRLAQQQQPQPPGPSVPERENERNADDETEDEGVPPAHHFPSSAPATLYPLPSVHHDRSPGGGGATHTASGLRGFPSARPRTPLREREREGPAPHSEPAHSSIDDGASLSRWLLRRQQQMSLVARSGGLVSEPLPLEQSMEIQQMSQMMIMESDEDEGEKEPPLQRDASSARGNSEFRTFVSADLHGMSQFVIQDDGESDKEENEEVAEAEPEPEEEEEGGHEIKSKEENTDQPSPLLGDSNSTVPAREEEEKRISSPRRPCRHADLPPRYRNTAGYCCSYCCFTVCCRCYEAVVWPTLPLHKELYHKKKNAGNTNHSQSVASSTSRHPMRSVFEAVQFALQGRLTSPVARHQATPASGAPQTPLLHSPTPALFTSPGTSDRHSNVTAAAEARAANEKYREMPPHPPQSCLICRKGVLMRSSAMLHGWSCEATQYEQRRKSSLRLYETTAIQRYYFIKEQRQTRQNCTEKLIAEFQGSSPCPLFLPPGNAYSRTDTGPLSHATHVPAPTRKRERASLTPHALHQGDARQREARQRSGSSPSTAVKDSGPGQRPYCEEGGVFYFSVQNPRLETACVWCAVNVFNGMEEHYPVSPNTGTSTVVPLFSFLVPPSLPGVPPQTFRVEVPYHCYVGSSPSGTQCQALALYLKSDVYRKTVTTLQQGGEGLRLVQRTPATQIQPLLVVEVLHHVASTPFPLQLSKRHPPVPWPSWSSPVELRQCLDHLFHGRSVAVYGIGSKFPFLCHVLQAAQLQQFPRFVVDGVSASAKNFCVAADDRGDFIVPTSSASAPGGRAAQRVLSELRRFLQASTMLHETKEEGKSQGGAETMTGASPLIAARQQQQQDEEELCRCLPVASSVYALPLRVGDDGLWCAAPSSSSSPNRCTGAAPHLLRSVEEEARQTTTERFSYSVARERSFASPSPLRMPQGVVDVDSSAEHSEWNRNEEEAAEENVRRRQSKSQSACSGQTVLALSQNAIASSSSRSVSLHQAQTAGAPVGSKRQRSESSLEAEAKATSEEAVQPSKDPHRRMKLDSIVQKKGHKDHKEEQKKDSEELPLLETREENWSKQQTRAAASMDGSSPTSSHHRSRSAPQELAKGEDGAQGCVSTSLDGPEKRDEERDPLWHRSLEWCEGGEGNRGGTVSPSPIAPLLRRGEEEARRVASPRWKCSGSCGNEEVGAPEKILSFLPWSALFDTILVPNASSSFFIKAGEKEGGWTRHETVKENGVADQNPLPEGMVRVPIQDWVRACQCHPITHLSVRTKREQARVVKQRTTLTSLRLRASLLSPAPLYSSCPSTRSAEELSLKENSVAFEAIWSASDCSLPLPWRSDADRTACWTSFPAASPALDDWPQSLEQAQDGAEDEGEGEVFNIEGVLTSPDEIVAAIQKLTATAENPPAPRDEGVREKGSVSFSAHHDLQRAALSPPRSSPFIPSCLWYRVLTQKQRDASLKENEENNEEETTRAEMSETLQVGIPDAVENHHNAEKKGHSNYCTPVPLPLTLEDHNVLQRVPTWSSLSSPYPHERDDPRPQEVSSPVGIERTLKEGAKQQQRSESTLDDGKKSDMVREHHSEEPPPPPVLLVIHRIDLLDADLLSQVYSLCAAYAAPPLSLSHTDAAGKASSPSSQRRRLLLLVSFDHPKWTQSAAYASLMNATAVPTPFAFLPLTSALWPRQAERRHVHPVDFLLQYEAAATRGGGRRGATDSRQRLPLSDTLRRVLFSLPVSFSGLLRHLIAAQEEVGEGRFTSVFLLMEILEERGGTLLSQGRWRSLQKELTSNRLAVYDPAEHALMIPQPKRLLKVLEEVTKEREAGRGGLTSAT